MARLARAEVFDPSEVAVLHLCARVVRRCFIFGVDPLNEANPFPDAICQLELHPAHHLP